MNQKVAMFAAKKAGRHPKHTLKAARFAVRHRQGLLETAQQARIVARVMDESFRNELLAGLSALQAAAIRTQKVGATKALQDKQVNKLLREAAAHTTAAVQPKPKRRRRVIRTIAVASVAAGVTAIAIRQWLVTGNAGPD
jgi:hypothetical protein